MHTKSVTFITESSIVAGHMPVGNRLITQAWGTCVSHLTLGGHSIGVEVQDAPRGATTRAGFQLREEEGSVRHSMAWYAPAFPGAYRMTAAHHGTSGSVITASRTQACRTARTVPIDRGLCEGAW